MGIFNKIALKSLKNNKTRTLVTIIGILLSAAMFTAVTVSVSSIRHFLIERTYWVDGHYHVYGIDYSETEVEEIVSHDEISSFTVMQQIGWSREENSKNDYKPYLYLAGIQENVNDLVSIRVTEGRMPEAENEIILPEHLKTNGGVEYAIGDVLQINISERIDSEGDEINNQLGYEEGEQLEYQFTKEYTVVGYYMRPSFESYEAPGYTCLTVWDSTVASGNYDLYVTFSKISSVEDLMNSIMLEPYGYDKFGGKNSDLLRLSAVSSNAAYLSVLYSLAVILIVIIMFGSIALIYNAFAISVNERTKQFGILTSIGATRKQIRYCIMTEGVFLSIIGIPLGILVGIAGMAVTFKITGGIIGDAFLEGGDITLSVYPSWPAILIAVFITFITIMISANIPARKALKRNAIETIRQTDQVKLTAKNVKVPKLVGMLFGFEGMLAAKNFKRSKKKYRATVFSIFISIVLFIAASSFSAYLVRGMSAVYQDLDYNVRAVLRGTTSDDDIGENTAIDEYKILSEIRSRDEVKSVSFEMSLYATILVDRDDLTEEGLAGNDAKENATEIPIFVKIMFLDDDYYKSYCQENNVNADMIIVNENSYYDADLNKFKLVNLLKDNPSIQLLQPKYIESYNYIWYEQMDDGSIQYVYSAIDSNENEDMETDEIYLTLEESMHVIIPDSVALTLNMPLGRATDNLTIVYPYSRITEIFPEDDSYERTLTKVKNMNYQITPVYYIDSAEPAKTTSELTTYFEELENSVNGSVYSSVTDYASEAEYERGLITVINIFSYGFIVLISLIAIANIFNTISTNVELRKREIAMLKATGLGPSGLRRMMNFECIMYGGKGILYGMPVAIILTYIIYRAVGQGVEMNFFIPWYSIVIAIGSIFIIVFATMLYAMKKVTKGSTAEALKDETA